MALEKESWFLENLMKPGEVELVVLWVCCSRMLFPRTKLPIILDQPIPGALGREENHRGRTPRIMRADISTLHEVRYLQQVTWKQIVPERGPFFKTLVVLSGRKTYIAFTSTRESNSSHCSPSCYGVDAVSALCCERRTSTA